ncbi:hypothetical protein [Vibrio coralliilyticus]|uniref:hypothetical protein n=1 Tax=Vibrio coralliilyticus TaxID=190893 RepID=UPI00155F77F1|nr:hypothetical protein [Vibrio coralliilyticus]NRF64538.1 hypothetical protein [Vibrio coralliilyticus]
MNNMDNVTKNKVINFTLFFLFLSLISLNYSEVISPMYFEMNAINYHDVEFWVRVVGLSILFSVSFGNEIKRPSQLVILVLLMFVVTPMIIVAPYIHNNSSFYSSLTLYVLLFYVLTWGATSILSLFIKKKLPVGSIRKYTYNGNLTKALAVTVFFVSLYVFFKGYSIFDLSFSNYSFRRLAGRELFPPGAVMSYIVSIVNSAIVLFLISYSVLYRNLICLLIAALYVIVDWGVFGTKVTFVLSVATFLMMILYALGIKLKVYMFFIPMLLISLSSLLLYYFYGNELFADLTIRRITVMPAIISQAYADYISHTPPTLYGDSGLSRIFGNVVEQPTYIIGDHYFGKPDMNTNTNLVIMEIVRLGELGVVFASVIVSSVLITLDRLHSKNLNPMYIMVALLFGVRITEQALATLLISSGVVVLVIITYLLDVKSRPVFGKGGV